MKPTLCRLSATLMAALVGAIVITAATPQHAAAYYGYWNHHGGYNNWHHHYGRYYRGYGGYYPGYGYGSYGYGMSPYGYGGGMLGPAFGAGNMMYYRHYGHW